jgi:hypothetical protein
MAKYRLLVGTHIQAHPTEKRRELDDKGRQLEYPADIVYYAGDVFESDYNLLKFNAAGSPPKFALIDEAEEAAMRRAVEAAVLGRPPTGSIVFDATEQPGTPAYDEAYRAGYEAAMRKQQQESGSLH